jgi:hypothetical protein
MLRLFPWLPKKLNSKSPSPERRQRGVRPTLAEFDVAAGGALAGGIEADDAIAATDIESEVHAVAFKETVVERVKIHLRGDLLILHSPQLVEQVGHTFVPFLRLGDDQAEVVRPAKIRVERR